MPVILPCLPDPTDILVQGEQTVFQSVCVYAPLALNQVIQGEITTSRIPEIPVPSAMIGQHDWYGIKPRKIGPMAFGQAGNIDWLNIGAPVFVSPNIDPIQKWLNAPFPIDMTGMWFDLSADLLGPIEASATIMETGGPTVMVPDPMEIPVITIPRGAIWRSGLAKQVTSPVVGASFGSRAWFDSVTETTSRWFISGITKDSVGSPLAGCRVVALLTDKDLVNPDILANPIIAETVSDGSGNYSIQVPGVGPFMIYATLAGSPNKAGITLDSVVPTLI